MKPFEEASLYTEKNGQKIKTRWNVEGNYDHPYSDFYNVTWSFTSTLEGVPQLNHGAV